jgi:hypothetical protein
VDVIHKLAGLPARKVHMESMGEGKVLPRGDNGTFLEGIWKCCHIVILKDYLNHSPKTRSHCIYKRLGNGGGSHPVSETMSFY